MNVLNGQITDNNKLSGFLTSDNLELTGSLSADEVLVGQLISQESNLQGNLSADSILMEGIISIPPEIPTDIYEGEYEIVSKPFETSEIQTQGLKMRENIVVLEIPYYETSNVSGYTVYIGGE